MNNKNLALIVFFTFCLGFISHDLIKRPDKSLVTMHATKSGFFIITSGRIYQAIEVSNHESDFRDDFKAERGMK